MRQFKPQHLHKTNKKNMGDYASPQVPSRAPSPRWTENVWLTEEKKLIWGLLVARVTEGNHSVIPLGLTCLSLNSSGHGIFLCKVSSHGLDCWCWLLESCSSEQVRISLPGTLCLWSHSDLRGHMVGPGQQPLGYLQTSFGVLPAKSRVCFESMALAPITNPYSLPSECSGKV
jgi:hypothetical protein